MKKINYIFAIFCVFLTSNFCFADKVPDWVYNLTKECSKNEICATGSGTSSAMAKTDARNGILKYFETKINSEFRSNLSTDEINVKNLKSEEMEEISNGILKGVNIKKTYKKDGEYYAFAVLNKDIAIKETRSDIDKIDSKMRILVAENNIKYNKQLEKLYSQREQLNKRYLVLTGQMMPDVVKYDDIFNAKKKSGELSLTYYIEQSSGYEQQVGNYILNMIIDSGGKVTINKKMANRFIRLDVNKKNLYLKVKGFIKQLYVLRLEISDKTGNVISSIYQEFTESGRSESQILETINIKIQNYLSENIDKILQ